MSATVLIHAVSNTLVAGVVALVVVILSRWLRRPAILHLLWALVLLRLVAPAVIPVHVLPPAEAGRVEIEGGAVAVATAGPASEPSSQPLSVPDVLLGLWLAGAAVMTGVVSVRLWRARTIIRRAEPAPEGIRRQVAGVAAELGTRPLEVVLTGHPMPPALWGLGRRPRIVLPASLVLRLDSDQLRAVLAHELAHAARGDHWMRWFELAVSIVCWWNPVAWWARRQLRRAEERSCDERVVAALSDCTRAYAESLITTLRYLSTAARVHVPAATGMADLSEIQGRLTHIMKPKPTRPTRALLRWALAAVAAAVVLVSPLLKAADPADLPAVLNEPISVHLRDAAIVDFAKYLQQITGVPVLDQTPPGTTVTLHVRDVAVHDMLDEMSRSQSLTWSYTDGVIVIGVPVPPPPSVHGELDGAPVYRFNFEGFREADAPTVLNGPQPEYPEAAREAGVTGVVVLDALIDADGHVRALEELKSPSPELTEAAIRAVEQWTFSPAQMDGEPVAVRYTLSIRFALQ